MLKKTTDYRRIKNAEVREGKVMSELRTEKEYRFALDYWKSLMNKQLDVIYNERIAELSVDELGDGEMKIFKFKVWTCKMEFLDNNRVLHFGIAVMDPWSEFQGVHHIMELERKFVLPYREVIKTENLYRILYNIIQGMLRTLEMDVIKEHPLSNQFLVEGSNGVSITNEEYSELIDSFKDLGFVNPEAIVKM